MSERILDQKVAIIEYIMYNDTREGIVLHSAQWSMLEHLFPILKMFTMTAKEVNAETAPLRQVILFGYLLKKKAAQAITDLSWSQEWYTSPCLWGNFLTDEKDCCLRKRKAERGMFWFIKALCCGKLCPVLGKVKIMYLEPEVQPEMGFIKLSSCRFVHLGFSWLLTNCPLCSSNMYLCI